jgi:hypothetical protein
VRQCGNTKLLPQFTNHYQQLEVAMALGDGIRRNIASVDPAERALLRDALIELNHRFFPGNRTDSVPGGVSWWFKQDEIHQATHVHGGPEFLPWHREIVNRLEAMLRQINPQLSLHYWDWTQDPTDIPNANLGGGTRGSLDLFTTDFMGEKNGLINEPWLRAGYYVPTARDHRSTDPFDLVNNNPADPPREVTRIVGGGGSFPESVDNDNTIVNKVDYAAMRSEIDGLERAHNRAHGFVNMGEQHTSFRDPFVFLLHSNVDRLFARWQTDPAHPERLEPNTVYGSESDNAGLNSNIEPWSTGHSFPFGVERFTRPWFAPESEGFPKTYKHPSVVSPPFYDTNLSLQDAGFRPILVNGYSLGDQDLYASIWEKRDGPEWLARHRLTADQHQQLFEQLPAQGFRPILVNGYSLGDRDLYASIWEKRDGPGWLARHRLNPKQHQQLFKPS